MTRHHGWALGTMLMLAGIQPALAQDTAKATDQHRQLETLERVPPAKRSDRQQVELGQAYYQAGRLDDASRQAAQVLKHRPDDADAWKIQGDVAREKGHWKQALKAYEQAARLAPSRADVELLRGQALMELGREQEADRSFARYRALTQAQSIRSGNRK